MPRRIKEEERVETIIRGLLKEPENRRCINCNSLGPQYVCTTFWTFVCTICSGVHREFTHRVKSVSMAKFTEEEISALQAGGNERAREIYFKAWDPQRNSYPDGSNLHRLREFVKHVYIDRKYAGENKQLAMVKLDSRNNYLERRSHDKNDLLERHFSGRSVNSSSSRDDDLNERNSFDQSSPFKRNGGITFRDILEERSPGSSQRNRPTTVFEIVDDRYREDGSVKRYDHKHSIRESRGGGIRSPVSQTTAQTLRSAKEIWGEKVPALKIGGPPKYSEKKDVEGSGRAQNADDTTTTTQVPTSANQKQIVAINSNSLIDFDPKPEPAYKPSELPAITASENNNESSSVSSSATKTPPISAPNTISLELLLFDVSEPVSSPSAVTSQSNGSNATDRSLSLEVVPNDKPSDDYTKDLTVCTTPVHDLPSVQQNGTFLTPTCSNAQQSNNNPATSNDLNPVQTGSLEQSSEADNQTDGSKATARKEIPQDIFTSNFASSTPEVTSWQLYPPYGTGYGMQFRPPPMSVASFPNPVRPRNPFDIGDDGYQAQTAMSRSMSPLQGASPEVPPSTTLPSPYAYVMNMALVPGAYMGQLSNNTPITRPQENANLAKSEDVFASLNPIQLTSGANSSPPTAPNPSSLRTGNPFG